MNNSEEFLTKTKLRAMRMFSHRIVLYSNNLSLITGVRCVLAQLELWNVFEGQTEWTFGLSASLSVGPFPPNRRFVSTVCQRVWDIVSLRESQPSGHTQPHNDFWRARRKWGNDLVIYLGGTLHLWAQEFTDIPSGWHCLTLNDLKSIKTTAWMCTSFENLASPFGAVQMRWIKHEAPYLPFLVCFRIEL